MHATSDRRRLYVVAAVIVWVGVIAASAFLLAGSPQLAPMLAILGGAAFFFVALLPAGLFR
jgi:hypothetical protein